MFGSGAFGLRGRIVGAVILTTVATLVVAALALLGPLESKLRAAEFKTFKSELGRQATIEPFTKPPLGLGLTQVEERLYLEKPAAVPKNRPHQDQLAIDQANDA